MNCFQFEELFHDLDRPGTEGFAARESALAHAESCSRCARLLTQAESLDLSLKALSARGIGEQAPSHIEKVLREEFRRTRAVSSRRRVRWQIAALATAAAMLLALGLSLRHRGTQTAGSGSRSHNTATVAAGNGTNVSAPGAPGTDSGNSDVALAENEPADPDSETDFVPLPYADDSMAGEGGAIVRVVLSRPALASLGLPVTDMAATDRIPADIIVSEDGAPQAIRLVSQSNLDD